VFRKSSRTRKAALAASILLAMGAFVFAFSRVNPPATARAYFWLETKWIDHWPFHTGKWEIQKVVPTMIRLGVLRPVRVAPEPNISFLLDPRDLVSVSILRTGAWQPEIWDSISPNLSEGSVFLDVGAHIGYFSMKAARKVGQTGRVLSFEPNPETLKLLRDNVAANNLTNVIVEPIACTDREQMLTLYAAPSANTGASSLARQNADISSQEPPRPYPVRGRPIDDVVRELNLTRVDAIKIDVEGAEVFVLRGALDTLKRFHPKIVVEVVPSQLGSFQTTADDLISLIKSAGYNRSKPLNPERTDWEWTMQDPGALASVIRMGDPAVAGQLIKGFHAIEQNSWRWTDGMFTAALKPPPGANRNGAWLIVKLHVSEASIKQLHNLTLSATVGGAAVAPATFSIPGAHEYRREVPASAFDKEMVDADFSLDKFLNPTGVELGVVVNSIALESK